MVHIGDRHGRLRNKSPGFSQKQIKFLNERSRVRLIGIPFYDCPPAIPPFPDAGKVEMVIRDVIMDKLKRPVRRQIAAAFKFIERRSKGKKNK